MIIGNSNTRLKESFRAKVFSLFILFIVIVSVSITVFFILHESELYLEQLVSEGKQLSKFLAYNSRLAVFAENRDMLEIAAEDIVKNDHVTAAAIFSSSGELLTEVNKRRNSRDPK